MAIHVFLESGLTLGTKGRRLLARESRRVSSLQDHLAPFALSSGRSVTGSA